MGLNLGGLLAGVMKGAGEGGKVAAEYGIKLDMQKQLMDAQMEKDLRVDEVRRQRDIAQVKPMAEANAAAAPIIAQGEAAAAPIKTKAEIDSTLEKTKKLSESPEYLEGTKKIQRASKVVEREIASERANAIAGRGTGGGGGTTRAPRVQKTITGENGNVMAVMTDGTTKDLGVKSGDYNKQVSNLVTKMAKDDYKFAKLPEDEKRKQAEQRLLGGPRKPTTDAGKAERISLDTFYFND